MLIIIWSTKTGEILYQSKNPDDLKGYKLQAEAEGNGFFYSDTATSFPETNFFLIKNRDGVFEYRQLTIQEEIANGTVAFDAKTQKIVGDSIIQQSPQEMLASGAITLDQYKVNGYIRIDQEANIYLLTAKTKSGYLVNNDAQKIAIASLSITGTDASTALKGFLYTQDQATEILAYCAQVKTTAKTAKTAIKNALNISVVDSIHFNNYL